jgi:hypothetical protein
MLGTPGPVDRRATGSEKSSRRVYRLADRFETPRSSATSASPARRAAVPIRSIASKLGGRELCVHGDVWLVELLERVSVDGLLALMEDGVSSTDAFA